ncbi:MAG: rubrerythrin [Desulfuromonas sp.]|nr:MAG: rubrerythrin [Desulfuromonas sp.]
MDEEGLKQAIKSSIQTEKDAMDFYLCAAERVVNERPRLTFKLLSREEREHARSFYDAYRWNDLPPFDELMAAPPDTDSPWWTELQKTLLGDFDEEKALALAIRREAELEEALRKIAEQVDDEAVRQVYLSNAKMTHRHLELISEDYRIAQSSG